MLARRVHNGVNQALKGLQDISVSPAQGSAYDNAIKIYNPTYSYEHPAFVALPRSVEDVRRCLTVANSTRTPVAVKSGGHCFAGYSTIDSMGFVISLQKMRKVTLDLQRETNLEQTGVTCTLRLIILVMSLWGDVYQLWVLEVISWVGGIACCRVPMEVCPVIVQYHTQW